MEHKQTNSLDFCRTLLFTNRLGDRFSSWGAIRSNTTWRCSLGLREFGIYVNNAIPLCGAAAWALAGALVGQTWDLHQYKKLCKW